jgi:hypothetical protein
MKEVTMKELIDALTDTFTNINKKLNDIDTVLQNHAQIINNLIIVLKQANIITEVKKTPINNNKKETLH